MGTNQISDFNPILDNLSETLVKVELDSDISLSQFLKIASMPKMKFFCLAYGNVSKREEQVLKKVFPHLKFLEETLNVASPYPYGYEILVDNQELLSGFWEIKAELSFL